MYNREKVIVLRQQLSKRPSVIPQEPGVYRWWFPVNVAKKLIASLKGVDISKIQKEPIDNKEYWCLYFGFSKNLYMRFKWHITQHHTDSAVMSGTLSTLRKSISAVLEKDMSKAEDDVNNVLDTAYWDWHTTETFKDSEKIENEMLANCYFPLNIKKNKCVDKCIVDELKTLRRDYKK